jgi:hypothetical protein
MTTIKDEMNFCPFSRRPAHVRVRPATTAQKKGETTMKKKMLVVLAVVILSAAGMEAQKLQRRPEPKTEQRRPEREPESRPEHPPHGVPPENRPYNNVQPESHPNIGVNHPSMTVVRPTVIAPAMRRAMTYNTRPGGVHINPEYFATHYGYAHGFHFTNYAGGSCIGDCGLREFGGEWYFNWNDGWFGIMGQMPGDWAFQTDYLYIGIGDDGNYYLYDAQFPDVAVQLTFVQNPGDDQAGAEQD